MTESIFHSCSDACGWIAAVTAVLSFGSFGVPIKRSVKGVEMNALVMQSYKTITCFLTSWLVLLLGEEIRFSYYGILSGLFWVPGAACGIYGIRNAGMAVAVGTWSSIIVLTSFVFGIIIFQERVKNFAQTCFAFAFLVLGLIGMSRYSAHQPEKDDHHISSSLRKSIPKLPPMARPVKRTHSGSNDADSPLGAMATTGLIPLEMEPLVMADDEAMIMGDEHDIDVKNRSNKDRLVFFGARLSLTRRQLGILGAVVNGAWGGMNLIPLHYAMRYDGMTGAGYLISYATGSLIVNTAIWILLFAYYLYQKKGQWEDALECLPKWHLNQLLLPGLAAGLLYSLGNFSSIIAVTYLGQGTGFSFCQMQLFVSGLWGVFYFREIKGIDTISKWFASAAIAVTGIIWLSYQHEGDASAHR